MLDGWARKNDFEIESWLGSHLHSTHLWWPVLGQMTKPHLSIRVSENTTSSRRIRSTLGFPGLLFSHTSGMDWISETRNLCGRPLIVTGSDLFQRFEIKQRATPINYTTLGPLITLGNHSPLQGVPRNPLSISLLPESYLAPWFWISSWP